MNKIFVYGTLQRGMYNDCYMHDNYVKNCTPATTKGKLHMVKGCTYPAMIPGDYTVKGELYSIKEDYLEDFIDACDMLEGHPTFYKREIVKVVDNKGNEHEAYTYIFQKHELLGKLLPDGNYKSFYKKMEKLILKNER